MDKEDNKKICKYSEALKVAEQALKMNSSHLLVEELNKPMIELQNMTANFAKPLMANFENALIPIQTSIANSVSTGIGNIARKQLSTLNTSIALAMTTPISNIVSQIAETHRQFINTIIEQVKPMNSIFKGFSDAMEEARKNPDSMISWINYFNKLSDFFWIMPYKMTTEELHEILENVKNEKEFDDYLKKYFDKEKMKLLENDIEELLPNNNQKKVFRQIVEAYKNKHYALASIGLITMIDNSLSYFLINKGCTSRIGLFEPIIDDMDAKNVNSDFSFIVMMVNSNINLLYEDIEFNERISINTNKKSRRNPISHGMSYSYKKIDTIMLMNTLYYLLVVRNELRVYKNSIGRNNKKVFYLPTIKEKQEIIKNIKNKKLKNKIV